PITNIIASETDQDNDLIQNETNNVDARNLGKHLALLLFQDFEGDEKEFRAALSSSSYFINQKKLASELADELFAENSNES
ncbi:hypothetical protein N8760_08340, partial [Rhodobacteraceae bacterium]|nr:hypothetical protein [Paracoccaceae bacterium]